jgi:hypothetical protein
MCNRSQEVQLELGYMTEVGHATEVTYTTLSHDIPAL